MKIAYRSRHGVIQAVIPQLDPKDQASAEYRVWSDGQERDVPENLMVRWRPRIGLAYREVRAVDVLFDAGPDYVDAATGSNPDFQCAVCKNETLENYFVDPRTGKRVFLRTETEPSENDTPRGEPLCVVDFLARHPEHIDWFQLLGRPAEDLAEARKRAAALSDGAKPVPAQAARQAFTASAEEKE